MFQALKLPTNYKADQSNIGSLINFGTLDLVDGEEQGYAVIYSSWLYEDSNRHKGISPLTPVMYLVKPMRIIRGKCYCVI